MTNNDVTPSASHLCDMARNHIRSANTQMTQAMQRRDQELAKRPASMAKASQYQAEYIFHDAIATLMRRLMEDHCGL